MPHARLLPRLPRRSPQPNLHPAKLELIDLAFRDYGCRTFADLGGVWHVDGGYSLHALRHADRGVLVDTGADNLTDRARNENRLRLIRGDFTDPAHATQVGEVDIVFHFDTLLHQYEPDWRETLALYSSQTRAFLVCQPQWTGSKTIRLPTLGSDEYHRLITPPGKQPTSDSLALVETDPGSRRIWQWAITLTDLTTEMQRLGFRLYLFRNWGSWNGLERFERHAATFMR